MHLRLNIPPWTAAERRAGLRALFSRRAGDAARAVLRERLHDAVPGRRPVLLSSARGGIALWARRRGLAGKAVAVPALSCPAIHAGLRAGGAEPCPVDVERDGFRYDASALDEAVRGGRVAAIVVPSTWGLDGGVAALARHGLPFFDDAAYRAGLPDGDGRPAGGGGDGGAWSFSFKALTGPGGGVLWLPPEEVDALEAEGLPRPAAEPRRRFLDHVVRSRIGHRLPRAVGGAAPPREVPGEEIRAALATAEIAGMSGVQAAVAAVQWERRADVAAAAAANLAVVRDAVRGTGLFDEPAGGGDPVHLLPLLARGEGDAAVSLRRRVRAFLHGRGVQTEEPYPVPGGGAFPMARRTADRLVLVPCGAGLRPAEARMVADALLAAAEEGGVR